MNRGPFGDEAFPTLPPEGVSTGPPRETPWGSLTHAEYPPLQIGNSTLLVGKGWVEKTA
jgi:hypothetical protein